MASPRKIVVGYDGSDLTIVSVAHDKDGLEKTRALLEEASDHILRLRTFARLSERVGDPVDELRAAATETHADLLVVGNGKTRFERALHGSVSTSVVHRAVCDVLVAC